jgi:hypothetical protein
MDFEFSEDQQSLRELVARWADKAHPFERRHALAKGGGAARVVYGELGELGLAGLITPEANGGMGLGAVEAMVVMEELGRALVSAPYAAGALVAPSMLAGAAAEIQAAWLPAMAAADKLVVLAHHEPKARHRLDRIDTRAVQDGSGRWLLSGRKGLVPAGDEADAYLVPACSEDGIGIYLVERGAAGVAVRGHPTQCGGRAADIGFSAAPAIRVRADGAAALSMAVDVGIAASCAEGVGLMDRLVAMTVDYMNTRKQFGSTLASFQALRHRIADVKMQLELARSMSYYATLKLGEPEAQRRRALSQAKVQLGASTRFVGQQCVQLHGGIGVTDEYAGSHYFKRLTMLELSYGDGLHHLGEVSARMQETAGVFA